MMGKGRLTCSFSSPKAAISVFIGAQLGHLAEEADTMSVRDRAINWLSIIFGVVLASVLVSVIYKRTMARAAELAQEESEDVEAGRDSVDGDALEVDSADTTEQSRLIPDADTSEVGGALAVHKP